MFIPSANVLYSVPTYNKVLFKRIEHAETLNYQYHLPSYVWQKPLLLFHDFFSTHIKKTEGSGLCFFKGPPAGNKQKKEVDALRYASNVQTAMRTPQRPSVPLLDPALATAALHKHSIQTNMLLSQAIFSPNHLEVKFTSDEKKEMTSQLKLKSFEEFIESNWMLTSYLNVSFKMNTFTVDGQIEYFCKTAVEIKKTLTFNEDVRFALRLVNQVFATDVPSNKISKHIAALYLCSFVSTDYQPPASS